MPAAAQLERSMGLYTVGELEGLLRHTSLLLFCFAFSITVKWSFPFEGTNFMQQGLSFCDYISGNQS